MKSKLLSNKEIDEMKLWLQDKNNAVPTKIEGLFLRIIDIYTNFNSLLETNRSLADRLKELMGIKPKSERGSQLNQGWGIKR